MTLTINLTPSEEARLVRSAQQSGVTPADVLRRLIGHYLPEPQDETNSTASEDPTLALLASWIGNAPTDPKEVHAADEDMEQFMRNINAERRRAGMRVMYPDAE